MSTKSLLEHRSAGAELQQFEAMLPAIRRFATYAFRNVPYGRREELISDALADAYLMFQALVARGKVALAFPTALARYAVRRVRAGRSPGSQPNHREALSALRSKRGSPTQPHPHTDAETRWEELADHRRANPAELAALRLDFNQWLHRLQRWKQELALRLAAGDTTMEAARRFDLSCGRISQMRRELQENWRMFQGEPLAMS